MSYRDTSLESYVRGARGKFTAYQSGIECGIALVREIDGRKHRLLVSDQMFEAGPVDTIDLFIWSTDRPRGVMAGIAGNARIFGRRCAI